MLDYLAQKGILMLKSAIAPLSLAFVLQGATAFTTEAHPAAQAKQNVIVILSDDAGFNEFSMQRSKTITPPRIDLIVKAGMRFSNGYVSGTLCSPSRSGSQTCWEDVRPPGHLPRQRCHRNGWRQNRENDRLTVCRH